MVRLNYAKGWRFPGGGREAGEDARDAILRELREEIGLTGYGEVEMLQHTMNGEDSFLFLIRDVRYSPPSWSLEIADVQAFAPDHIPDELAGVAERQLDKVRELLPDNFQKRRP